MKRSDMRRINKLSNVHFSHVSDSKKRRPGGRLLPLGVIFVLLLTCVFITGCGSENDKEDAGKKPEQHISSVDDSKDKDAKKDNKEKSSSKDKKAEKQNGKKEKDKKEKASDNSNNKDRYSGRTSSGKTSDKTKASKEKAGNSSSDNKGASSDSRSSKHKKKAGYCYLSVTCHRLTAIKDELPKSLKKLVPDSGVILKKTKVKLKKDDNAFAITKRVLRKKGIHFSYQGATQYGTAYIEAINNIYEKDVNSRSGWIYKVNGKAPGIGCSAFSIGKNDVIEWAYTCDLGDDL